MSAAKGSLQHDIELNTYVESVFKDGRPPIKGCVVAKFKDWYYNVRIVVELEGTDDYEVHYLHDFIERRWDGL